MGNIFNDNSTNQYNTDLILEPLESLKSKIISIVNNSYNMFFLHKYYQELISFLINFLNNNLKLIKFKFN